MIKQNALRFFIPFLITIITSCNGNNSEPATTDTVSTSSTTSKATVPQGQILLPGELDTLWVAAATFSSLQQKLAFRFYLDPGGALLMNGWNTNGNGPYNPTPDLTLEKGRVSSVKYRAGDYLGNLLLSSNDVQLIQRKAHDSKALYIIFAPIDPATARYPGQITYSILLTSDDPHPLVKIANPNVVPTGISTNPSPPGTAN